MSSGSTQKPEDSRNHLLGEERRRSIQELLHREGKVVSSRLTAEFGVSEDTIRRDLRDLAEAGLLLRVHGGALPRSPIGLSPDVRERIDRSAKEAIADAAIQFVRNGQVVIIDSGTTPLQVARHLPLDLRATVITNSPPVAVALTNHRDLEVTVIGGRLNKEALSTTGGAALDTLRDIRADLCILGLTGLHPEIGIGANLLEEVYVKRAMIAGAAEVVAVATAEKLGTAAPYTVGPAHDLTHLITERGVADAVLAPYRALGIDVLTA